MIKLDKLTPNPNNPRLIKNKKFSKLKMSLEEFPKMMELRPIVVDREMIILGGNMRYKALMALGHKEIPDNWIKIASELTDVEKKRFVVEDNLPFGEWDWETLSNEFEVGDLLEWGFNEKELQLDDEGIMYSKDYKLPAYEPNDKKPKLNEIYDTTKTDELIKEIKKTNIPEDVKQFLISGAHRHTIFNYSKIADLYSNSDNETKKLFENSALVLIDIDKAIENGFIKLTQDLMDLQKEDGQNEE